MTRGSSNESSVEVVQSALKTTYRGAGTPDTGASIPMDVINPEAASARAIEEEVVELDQLNQEIPTTKRIQVLKRNEGLETFAAPIL